MPNTRYYILNTKRGFTLIELLIVIGIIGILAGVIIAVINPAKQRSRAKDSVLEATVEKLSIIMESHYNTNFSYPANCGALQAESGLITCPYGTTNTYYASFSNDVAIPSLCEGDTYWGYLASSTRCRVLIGFNTGNYYDGCIVVRSFSVEHGRAGAYIVAKYGKVIRATDPWDGGCNSISR